MTTPSTEAVPTTPRLLLEPLLAAHATALFLVEELGFSRVGEQKGAAAFKGTISDEYRYERRRGS